MFSEIGKEYPQVGPMSNEDELAIADIHVFCDSKNFGGDDDDSAYESHQSSDTPHSPVDEGSDPFQDDFPIEHSQIEPEEPVKFYYKNEYAIDDITRGIAFVLVHEHKAEKIGSANIRSIVEAGKVNYCNNTYCNNYIFQ